MSVLIEPSGSRGAVTAPQAGTASQQAFREDVMHFLPGDAKGKIEVWSDEYSDEEELAPSPDPEMVWTNATSKLLKPSQAVIENDKKGVQPAADETWKDRLDRFIREFKINDNPGDPTYFMQNFILSEVLPYSTFFNNDVTTQILPILARVQTTETNPSSKLYKENVVLFAAQLIPFSCNPYSEMMYLLTTRFRSVDFIARNFIMCAILGKPMNAEVPEEFVTDFARCFNDIYERTQGNLHLKDKRIFKEGLLARFNENRDLGNLMVDLGSDQKVRDIYYAKFGKYPPPLIDQQVYLKRKAKKEKTQKILDKKKGNWKHRTDKSDAARNYKSLSKSAKQHSENEAQYHPPPHSTLPKPSDQTTHPTDTTTHRKDQKPQCTSPSMPMKRNRRAKRNFERSRLYHERKDHESGTFKASVNFEQDVKFNMTLEDDPEFLFEFNAYSAPAVDDKCDWDQFEICQEVYDIYPSPLTHLSSLIKRGKDLELRMFLSAIKSLTLCQQEQYFYLYSDIEKCPALFKNADLMCPLLFEYYDCPLYLKQLKPAEQQGCPPSVVVSPPNNTPLVIGFSSVRDPEDYEGDDGILSIYFGQECSDPYLNDDENLIKGAPGLFAFPLLLISKLYTQYLQDHDNCYSIQQTLEYFRNHWVPVDDTIVFTSEEEYDEALNKLSETKEAFYMDFSHHCDYWFARWIQLPMYSKSSTYFASRHGNYARKPPHNRWRNLYQYGSERNKKTYEDDQQKTDNMFAADSSLVASLLMAPPIGSEDTELRAISIAEKPQYALATLLQHAPSRFSLIEQVPDNAIGRVTHKFVNGIPTTNQDIPFLGRTFVYGGVAQSTSQMQGILDTLPRYDKLNLNPSFYTYSGPPEVVTFSISDESPAVVYGIKYPMLVKNCFDFTHATSIPRYTPPKIATFTPLHLDALVKSILNSEQGDAFYNIARNNYLSYGSFLGALNRIKRCLENKTLSDPGNSLPMRDLHLYSPFDGFSKYNINATTPTGYFALAQQATKISLNVGSSSGPATADIKISTSSKPFLVFNSAFFLLQLIAGSEEAKKLLYLFEAKPKLEILPREKYWNKSRVIFATSVTTQMPMMLLADGFKDHHNPHVLLGCDPTTTFWQIWRSPDLHWFVYSDNIYYFTPDGYHDFDGSTMESSIQYPVFSLVLDQIRRSVNERNGVLRWTYDEGLDESTRNQIIEIIRMWTRTDNGKIRFLLSGPPQYPSVALLQSKTFSLPTDLQEVILLLSGQTFDRFEIDHGSITFTFTQPEGSFLNTYIDLYKHIPNKAVGIMGTAAFRIPFMPSGIYLTAILNTVQSWNAIVDDSGTLKQLGTFRSQVVAKSFFRRKNGARGLGSVITIENEGSWDERSTPWEPKSPDFLGWIHITEIQVLSETIQTSALCLRINSLIGMITYQKNRDITPNQKLVNEVSKLMSWILCGGIFLGNMVIKVFQELKRLNFHTVANASLLVIQQELGIEVPGGGPILERILLTAVARLIDPTAPDSLRERIFQVLVQAWQGIDGEEYNNAWNHFYEAVGDNYTVDHINEVLNSLTEDDQDIVGDSIYDFLVMHATPLSPFFSFVKYYASNSNLPYNYKILLNRLIQREPAILEQADRLSF